jgi:hypothetical protein
MAVAAMAAAQASERRAESPIAIIMGVHFFKGMSESLRDAAMRAVTRRT